MPKGRPHREMIEERNNNNLESDLDTMQDFKEEGLIMYEDETEEAGQGTEMEFYNDDEEE